MLILLLNTFYSPIASNWSFPDPKDGNIPLLSVVIDDPEDEVVAATLASIIKLALRCAFSTGDKVGSFSTEG